MRIKRRSTGLFVIVAAFTLVVPLAVSAGTAATPRPILIGVNVSLTGAFAPLGTGEKNGIVLRAKQINAKGGINGRKIALRILDDASSPTQAVTNANRLIADGAVAILGPIAGGLTAPVTSVTARRNVLHLAGSGSDVVGTTAGPTIFHIPPKVSVWGTTAACYVQKVLKSKRVAMMHSTDPGQVTASTAFKAALGRAGIEVVIDEPVEAGAADTSVQWTKIRAARPDVYANFITGATGGLTLRTGRDLGVVGRIPVVGWLSWMNVPIIRVASGAAEGAVGAHLLSGTDPLPSQALFVRTYTRNYQVPPDHNAGWGYDLMGLAGAAIQGTGLADPGQRHGLRYARWLETHTFKGAFQGLYRFGKFTQSNTNDDEHGGIKESAVLFLKVSGENLVRQPAAQQPKC